MPVPIAEVNVISAKTSMEHVEPGQVHMNNESLETALR